MGMKGQTQLALLAVAVTAAFSGERPSLRREGQFWVEEQKGSERIAARSAIRIKTVGSVSIQGVAGDEFAYTVIKRVKARNEMEARRLLTEYSVRSSRVGEQTFLTVQGGNEMPDVQVTAPQNISELMIETRAGAIDASQFEGTVHAITGAGRVALDQIGGKVVARTAGGELVLGKIGGAVRCVSGGGPIRADVIRGEAYFETAGGDIIVQRVDGPVHCSTAGGGIHIAQAGNIVIADTLGGPIDVGYAKGMVTAKNSGGPIQVGSSTGAKCESVSGAIRLTSVGGSLQAATAVGSIIARFQTQPVAESFLSTGAGDITVWIPSNLRVTVMARNSSFGGSRRIVSDFAEINVKPAGSATLAQGNLNGGGPLVRISGTAGVIYIRREEK